MTRRNVLGILVGGGPAPGINGVIGSATIRACNSGFRVVGIYDGYAGLMGKVKLETIELSVDAVRRIQYQGGEPAGYLGRVPRKSSSPIARRYWILHCDVMAVPILRHNYSRITKVNMA